MNAWTKKGPFLVLFLGFVWYPFASQASSFTLVDEIFFEGDEGHVSGLFSPGPHSLTYRHPSNHPVEAFPDPQNILSASLTITIQDDLHDPLFTRECWLVFTDTEWLNRDSWWAAGLGGPHPFFVEPERIRESGGVEITVMSLWGDFYVTGSTLELTYERGSPTPVPEPKSVLLLGAGLIGIAGVMRKKWPHRTCQTPSSEPV